MLELRKDSARFREDIRRAEDELITRAKVQKNPTVNMIYAKGDCNAVQAVTMVTFSIGLLIGTAI